MRDGWIALVVTGVPAAGRLGGPHPVDRLAVDDREEPADGAAPLRLEPAGGPPDLEERLLGDLLGLGRVSQDPHREAEGPGAGGVVEGRESLGVATGRTDEQGGQGVALRRTLG